MARPTQRLLNPWIDATERRESLWRRLTPPQLFVGSFASLIVLCWAGLMALPGLYAGDRLGWIDALFTATSAVCITGLIVVDTATFFTPLGQAFLLVFIQLGGIGMIAFTTLIIIGLGRRLSIRHERITQAAADVAPHVNRERLARDVVIFTVAFEAVGAGLLYAFWVPSLGWSGAIWPAVFHSVSAFCNAGFSTFSDSLMGAQAAPGILATVMALVVAGSLGFLTMEEVMHWRRARRAANTAVRLSIHTRLVLVTTAALIVLGWAAFVVFEWRGVLAHLSAMDRLVNALFMSITPRTAGFNTVDYTATTESSNFFSIILMFVGGSPGSMAGGIKTTALALLALLAWSRFRGREIVDVAGRSIPAETIQRAVGLTLSAFALVTAAIFMFTFTEAHQRIAEGTDFFLGHMFEAVSAFNTVGLSMGITPTLTDTGKIVTTLLMFMGRVGPLTFAAALALSAHRTRVYYRYAREDVVVG